MPVIHFNARDLEALLGKEVPRKKLIEDIPMLGADVDHVEGDDWAIEFFPDRPDLYTVEGIARALRQFYGFEPGLRVYTPAAVQPGTDVQVDASVATVRPFIAAAIVENIEITDRRLQAIIDLQEDLHWGLGARRRKVAIGIHDLAPLQGPFTYRAVDPGSVTFVPLQSEEPMTLAEILEKHPKGRDYAHLVKGFSKYPLITDAKGQVLSFPPVINGRLTTVTTATRRLFLDVTGTDQWAVDRALNLLATTFMEAGATVHRVAIRGEGMRLTPNLDPDERTLDVARVNRLLGTPFTPEHVAECLGKMGFGARVDGATLRVKVPPYRVDIMHEVDLIEDVAIGHGINAFERDMPRAVTYGRALPWSETAERVRQAMTGYGFLEVMGLSLSNDRDQFEKLGLTPGWAVRVKNPVTEDHTQLRTALLPSLLNVLRKNAHRDLPQQLFEVGVATVEGANGQPVPEKHVAAVLISGKAGFSDAKGLVLALARDLGWNVRVEAAESPVFTKGRCARLVTAEGEALGHFGEVNPATLQAFGLGYQTVAFEFKLLVPPPPLP